MPKSMDLVSTYKKAYQDLDPHVPVVWTTFFLAVFTSFFFLIPPAGFLMMLLRAKRDGKKPDITALFSQLDHFIALLILLVLSLGCALAYYAASAMLQYLSSALFQIFRFSTFVLFIPFLITVQTHAILLICDQRLDAMTALKKVCKKIAENPVENFLLGLGAILLMIPCLVGGPVACQALINAYEKQFGPEQNAEITPSV